MATNQKTYTIDGTTYLIETSCIGNDPKFNSIKAAFSKRGIIDHVNAVNVRAPSYFVQLFIMHDGTAKLSNSFVCSEVAREASGFTVGERTFRNWDKV